MCLSWVTCLHLWLREPEWDRGNRDGHWGHLYGQRNQCHTNLLHPLMGSSLQETGNVPLDFSENFAKIKYKMILTSYIQE